MSNYIKSKSFHKSGPSRGRAILSLLIIVSLCLMGLLYLMQTNGVVSQAYQIRQQKEYLKGLQTKNQNFQIETSRLQSPANLEEITQQLGMVEVDKIVYLEKEGAVAIKK